MLNERRGFPQLAVCFDGKHRHAAAAIIGDQHILACPIHTHVAWPGAFGRHRVQQGQLARLGLDAERAHGASVRLGHGIEITVIRMQCEKGRVRRLTHQSERIEFPALRIEAEGVIPLLFWPPEVPT